MRRHLAFGSRIGFAQKISLKRPDLARELPRVCGGTFEMPRNHIRSRQGLDVLGHEKRADHIGRFHEAVVQNAFDFRLRAEEDPRHRRYPHHTCGNDQY